MNPLILTFADGTMFFVGLALVLLPSILLLRFRKGRTRAFLTILSLVGLGLVAISATPLPLWMYALWTIPLILTLILGNRSGSAKRPRIAAGAVLALTTLTLATAEARYRIPPRLGVANDTTIYVLGDSISAGMGTPHRCWPAVMDDMVLQRVINLAQPGATVHTALKQAEGITDPGAFVIVEIGGNDLLGKTDAATFRAQLDTLLASLAADGHQILMLELPLFPLQNAYGAAQRDLARKYDAALLPRKYFTRVLGAQNATLDGLHLSQQGHDAMAAIIAEIIRPQ